jgi:hypothetical protein
MWLKDDIEELKRNWKESPWWVKTWMAISMFLGFSSFASLSETVVQWKGFFLDAIEFYREWISGPLREFIARFGVQYTEDSLDLLVLASVLIGIIIRSFAVDVNWSDSGSKRLYWLFSLGMIGILALSFFLYANADRDPNPSGTLLAGVLVCIGGLLFARHHRVGRLIVVQIVFAAAAVGVLGAINAGLSRHVQ